MTDQREALLVCNDLIFQSKIVGTARELGLAMRVVPTPRQAIATIGDQTCLAIVDLADHAATSPDILAQLRTTLPEDATLLAYGSHVDVDHLRAARAAGCDPVLPRSDFTARLVEILNGAVQSDDPANADSADS
ncbi:hypothetical protein Pan216_56720 [Planctomycetes bacterium Pan216]|uniref:Response regulatory domain-containing protein n=1 Tax=Kolteria novifilia TaxID=2527975 RepID=A0A518BCR2_9BACT|nr:hypothetical protein Pan216_56720 [Planctomycetes bacterium Pan216]